MKKLAIILRKIADKLDTPTDRLDATVELNFPKRNLSFNLAVESIMCLSPKGRSHFFRRLVIGITREDRIVLDEHLQQIFDDELLNTNFEQLENLN
jgi:thermostable 8-oxoguanine DNA glycosylase